MHSSCQESAKYTSHITFLFNFSVFFPQKKTFSEESNPWLESDRDYTYDELLQRVFGIMRDKNPDMVAGEKKKFVMRPPQVMRVGTKKTAFVNFTEMAKMLHRQPKHLLAFLFAELGTVGAIDGNNQLIIKGRFQQKHIENVLRRYIKVTTQTVAQWSSNINTVNLPLNVIFLLVTDKFTMSRFYCTDTSKQMRFIIMLLSCSPRNRST